MTGHGGLTPKRCTPALLQDVGEFSGEEVGDRIVECSEVPVSIGSAGERVDFTGIVQHVRLRFQRHHRTANTGSQIRDPCGVAVGGNPLRAKRVKIGHAAVTGRAAGDQNVITSSTVQCVQPQTTDQNVSPIAADKSIRARISYQHIVQCVTRERIVG